MKNVKNIFIAVAFISLGFLSGTVISGTVIADNPSIVGVDLVNGADFIYFIDNAGGKHYLQREEVVELKAKEDNTFWIKLRGNAEYRITPDVFNSFASQIDYMKLKI